MKKISKIYSLLLVILLYTSCDDFVELGAPDGSLGSEEVFSSAATAEAAVLDLYSGASAAIENSIYFSGLSSDELVFNLGYSYIVEFENNSIDVFNNANANMWLYHYDEIRTANIVIAALEDSPIEEAKKNQLLGEAKFWRAYHYIPLVMLFERIPLALSPNSKENALLPQSSPDEIWEQIFLDLEDAKEKLGVEYVSLDRARVNKLAVSALLARAYLYTQNWQRAEEEASTVINSGVYSLSSALETVFTTASNETILQLYNLNGYTDLGVEYIPVSPTSGLPNYGLREGFVDSFEEGDARRALWVGEIEGASAYYINKYRLRGGNAGDEYLILFRLAEMYLIRAEARAELGDLSGAEEDLAEVRTRAMLPSIEGLDKAELLLAIEQERKVELFGEWHHRWFDLIRRPSTSDSSLTRADDVLEGLKPEWETTDVLYPIPAAQISVNPSLEQNSGY